MSSSVPHVWQIPRVTEPGAQTVPTCTLLLPTLPCSAAIWSYRNNSFGQSVIFPLYHASQAIHNLKQSTRQRVDPNSRVVRVAFCFPMVPQWLGSSFGGGIWIFSIPSLVFTTVCVKQTTAEKILECVLSLLRRYCSVCVSESHDDLQWLIK